MTKNVIIAIATLALILIFILIVVRLKNAFF